MVRRNRGFTLLELLLCVVIIAVLIAIIIPAVKAARNSSNAAACLMNLRELGKATMAFSAQNNGRLPGNHTQYRSPGYGDAMEATATGTYVSLATGKLDISGKDPATGTGTANTPWHGSQQIGQGILKNPQYAWMGDWLCGFETGYCGTAGTDAAYNATNQAARGGFFSQPTRGTIYPYVNTLKAYRCPTLSTVKPGGGSNTSNGQYDYTMVNYLNGSRVDRIARTTTAYKAGFTPITFNTPVILEEDAGGSMNLFSAGTDGAWCNDDKLTTQHKGGTNIMTLDGSAFWFVGPSGFTVVARYLVIPSTAPSQISVPKGASGNTQNGWVDNTPFGFYNVN